MGPKGKSVRGKKGKGNKRKERDEEEGERGGEQQKENQEKMAIGSDQEEVVADDDDEEEGEPSTRQFDSVEDVTGKLRKEKYEFDAPTEQRLVEFFGDNDCFYDKGSIRYANTKFKNHLMETLATELSTSTLKISKWFAGQRTTLGKLLQKPKSGSKAKPPTARQKWQLANFVFLKDHIRPRSHTHDTGELPGGKDDVGDDEEELEVGSTASSQKASTFEGQCTSTNVKRAKGSSTKMEDALLSFLQRPRTSESLAQKMQEWDSGALDDKRAFGNWFTAKMLKIPEERWDAFEDEAQALVARYTRQQPMQQPTMFQPQQSQWCQPQEQIPQQHQPQQRQQLQWSQPQHPQWFQPQPQQTQNRTQPPLQQWLEWQPHPQPQELSNPPHSSGSTALQQDPLPEPVLPPRPHSTGTVGSGDQDNPNSRSSIADRVITP